MIRVKFIKKSHIFIYIANNQVLKITYTLN